MSLLPTNLIRGAGRLFNAKTFAAALLAALALASLLRAPAHAQEPPEPAAEELPGARRRADRTGINLLMRLNLSPEQLRQLRELRRRSEPEARALGRRLNLARRALDEAIYSDALDEAVVEERAREVAAAQAALARLRALTELRVRRVLTPAQLQSFRELRQQARRRQRAERRRLRRAPQPADPESPAAPSRHERRRRP